MTLPLPAPTPDIGTMNPEAYIGKTGYYIVTNPDPRRDSGALAVPVRIVDAKSVFGRIDVEIETLDRKGSGSLWVSLSSLEGVK